MDADGDFVVVWEAERQLPDGSIDWDVYGRRYDSAGQPLGGEFVINTDRTNDQADPAVAMDAAGNFVIAWESDSQDKRGSKGVYAQRYDPTGQVQRFNVCSEPLNL